MNWVQGGPRRALGLLRRSSFVRNVAVVASGTAGAQAVTLAFAPLITRIYGPEAFGLLWTFTAIVNLGVRLAALAYPMAVVLPKTDQVALGLVRLSAYLSLVFAAIVAIIFVGLGQDAAALVGAEGFSGLFLLVPLAILFSSLAEIARYWLLRKRAFASISFSVLTHSVLTNGAKAASGWLYPLAATLVVITTMGHVLIALMLALSALRVRRDATDPAEKSTIAVMSLGELARRHRDFPLYRAPKDLLLTASHNLPTILLAALYGPAAAGFYALGRMVMGLPGKLIGKAVYDVFLPRIAEAANRGADLPTLIVRGTVGLTIVGALPFVVIALVGPWLFALVFGAEWSEAGAYARWLSIFVFLNLVGEPSLAAAPSLGVQRGVLFFEIAALTARALGLIIGFLLLESEIWSIALFSVLGSSVNAAMVLWVVARARQPSSIGRSQ